MGQTGRICLLRGKLRNKYAKLMADNYLEKQYEEYAARKAAWERAAKYRKKEITPAKSENNTEILSGKQSTKRFTYRKLDAFTSGKSKGNPAACLYLEKDQQLTEEEMLTIAKDHKGFVSEVVYCSPLDDNAYRLRYYSSECEVEFCGHGTIACMYNLVKSNKELQQTKEITIKTNKGDLKVYNELQSLDAVFITAPAPEYLEVKPSLTDIAFNLQTTVEVLNQQHPVMLIDAGLRTLIVPIMNLDNILGLQPDEPKLKEFCLNNDIDIILVFSNDIADKLNKIRTRVFAPKFGYLEDPATGSGNSAMGYYMLKNEMWNGDPVSIEQNAEKELFNTVKLKTLNNQILFGGSAVVKIDGEYFL